MAKEPLPLDAAEIPEELPGLALRSTVVFPFDVVSVARPAMTSTVARRPMGSVWGLAYELSSSCTHARTTATGMLI